MAEEITKEKKSEEECKALYELLVKKDLTDEEKAKIKETVEKNPQILAQEEFTKNFKLTDFASEYKEPKDLAGLLEQNAKDVDVLNTALTNLKDCRVFHKGKNKTAAACLLDMPILENGELIGTELVKNIHFLGTAKQDKSVSESLKTAIEENFAKNEAFYKSLYAADGYGAYRNARNLSGQKVEKLMLECVAMREGPKKANELAEALAAAAGSSYVQKIENVQIQDKTIADVQGRTFMAHPVNPNKERKTLEVGDYNALAEKVYRGTATVEEKERYNKMKKDKEKEEADFAKKDLAPHHHEKKDRDDKFAEKDVIDYMYNEWFLAGLSWCFDKAEDLLDIALDKLIDTSQAKSARRAKEAHEAKEALAKEVIGKVQRFEDAADGRIDLVKKERAEKNAHFANDLIEPLKGVDFTALDSKKEEELKKKYSPYLIDGLKEQAKAHGQEAIDEFLEKCPNRYKSMFSEADTIKVIAMKHAKLEMIDEVMWSTGAWRKKLKTEFKPDEDLLKIYDKRCLAYVDQLNEAVAAVRADARITAEAKWSGIDATDTEKQRQFIDENILSKYDEEIALAKTTKDKKEAVERKEQFEKAYRELPEALRTEYMLQTVAGIEARAFLKEQTDLIAEAKRIQNQDRADCRYAANGEYPHKDTSDTLNKATNRRDSACKNPFDIKELKEERKGDAKAQKDLYEAAFETDEEKMLGKIAGVAERDVAKLETRRLKNDERKKILADFLQKLEIKKKINNMSLFLMGQQRQER